MKKDRESLTKIIGFFLLFKSSLLFSSEVVIRMPNNESLIANLPNKVSATTVMNQVERQTGFPSASQAIISDGKVLRQHQEQAVQIDHGQEFWMELKTDGHLNEELISQRSYTGYRNYHAPLNKNEVKDIHFILKILATKSLVSLLSYKSQLEKKGKRIDHVHPLQFLFAVFTDEEMKMHMYNLEKKRGWVWRDFMKGLSGSLQDESEIGNMKDSYVEDFANKLRIPVKLISGSIASCQWGALVKTLINSTKEGDSGRYGH
ncbi:MAG: hypothetical protein WB791_02515 [Waddliaceae bacterium]